jgi:transposase
MAKREYIIDLYENEEMSLRAIAEETGHHFNTVKKYATQTNWNQEEKAGRRREFVAMKDYTEIVDRWLEADQKEPRNQRHTISKVYKRLKNEHKYTGSYGSVKRYYNYKKSEMKQHKESFLPLARIAGNCQVDFGEFKYYDGNGEGSKGHALIVSFPQSNTGWMQVYPSENQECLLTGMKRIFYHIGGVAVRVKCDNMSTAVAHILEGKERVITDGFYRFMLHHRFSAEFCNPSKGNEKGNVENKVGYTRRNMLVPVPIITDFEAFNEELLRLCDADHAEREHYEHGIKLLELWEEEKNYLLNLPAYEYEVYRYESLRVAKDGYIKTDTNKYCVSPEMGGKIIQAKIYFDKIEVYYDHSLLKTFRRSYGKNDEDSNWKDYLPSLVKKPGAVEHTQFFDQMPKLWQQYLKSISGRERKSALMLLSEIVNDGNETLCDETLELAGEYGTLELDNIRQCYLFISKPERHPKPIELPGKTPLSNYQPDLSVYDGLMNGGDKS